MPIVAPSVAQLSDFSGRPLNSYGPYADQALLQAAVMFMLVTELQDMPTDPFEAQIAQFGILHYADTLVLEQPYQQVLHNPFQSETMGSTSYSKPVAYARGNAATNALKGEQTGITWFDFAIQKLAKRTEFGGVFGESTDIKWSEEVFVKKDHMTGELSIVGPAEKDKDFGAFGPGSFNVNSESWPAQANPPGIMRG
jgi:hypothetical protein